MELLDLSGDLFHRLLDRRHESVNMTADLLIAFQQLDSDPTEGIGAVKALKGVHDLIDTLLDLRTVEYGSGHDSNLSSFDDTLHQLIEAFSPHRHRGNHGDSQLPRQNIEIYGYPPLLGHVELVQGNDHPRLQLQQLQTEKEIPLQARSVDDVHQDIRLLDGDVLPAHQLLHGVGGEAVDAREIDDIYRVALEAQGALGPLHSLPGPVAHVLMEAGELIEDDALAHVGVTR